MKTLARAFALALVVTGAAASTHTPSTYTTATLSPRAGALPIPTCPPDGTTSCGIEQFGWGWPK